MFSAKFIPSFCALLLPLTGFAQPDLKTTTERSPSPSDAAAAKANPPVEEPPLPTPGGTDHIAFKLVCPEYDLRREWAARHPPRKSCRPGRRHLRAVSRREQE